MRRLLGGLTLAAAAVVAVPAPAGASCAEFPPLARHIAAADVVFSGTVVDLANDDRTATFAVAEVWHGPDLPATVRVHGGGDEPGMFTSADRLYRDGERYLVAADLVDGRLTDNACTATRPWEDALAALRPSDARQPLEAEDAGRGELPVLPLAMVGLAALILLGSVLAFRVRG